MTRLLSITLLALIACQTVFGHYQLTYPPSRGFDESREVTAPCGGFNTVSKNRTDFPLKNGFLEINSEHIKYTYKVFAVIGNNPNTAEFGSDSNVIGQGQVNYPSESCLQVDFSSIKNATDGTPATLQVIYMAGDGDLYQCTDVTLKTEPSNFNSSACINADGSSPSGSSGSQPSSTSAASTIHAGAVMTVMALVLSVIIA
ncbi:hypothetical protein BCR42DRAFT_447575 [Absidia repens]|uniref:Copper acquisition factor BIM1-like domain-containing protein n=1 Tax=Absidia repens TaxID=90262 RepID=A0A1X2ITZ8_9FUNG|nr:hypothetical protein BCR42DRAFT_447575 [Absidia repens]